MWGGWGWKRAQVLQIICQRNLCNGEPACQLRQRWRSVGCHATPLLLRAAGLRLRAPGWPRLPNNPDQWISAGRTKNGLQKPTGEHCYFAKQSTIFILDFVFTQLPSWTTCISSEIGSYNTQHTQYALLLRNPEYDLPKWGEGDLRPFGTFRKIYPFW